MKVFLLLLCFTTFFLGNGYSQEDTLRVNPTVPATTEPVVNTDTAKPKPVIKKPVPKPPQVKDSVKPAGLPSLADTALPVVASDSLKTEVVKDFNTYGDSVNSLIGSHPFYNLQKTPDNLKASPFNALMKDELFYAVCALLLFIGLLRLGFPKYFSDLFNIFWRSSIRQNQLRDQLQQAGLTNLLFNLFFVLSVSLFVYLGVTYTRGAVLQPWILFSICFFAVMFLYMGKFAILKICGWMFGKSMASDTYIFIVFLVNKIMAILLLPFIIVLAFSSPGLQQIAFTTAICLIIFLFFYRFVLSFSGIRNDLKLSGLHLFLYICGFEIMPVLVIYRIMLHLFERSS